MTTVLLVRHGRTTANTDGVLAGRAPGVRLDETGHEQAALAAGRLAGLSLAAVVSSPLERCRQTAHAIVQRQSGSPVEPVDDALTECDYGDWQGGRLAELAKEELWSQVQTHPSAVVFPGGESIRNIQARAVSAVREHDATFAAQHGSGATWAAVSHGDVIKAILADALGLHLDLFQRIHVHPGSVSIVRYTAARPDVIAINTAAGELSWLRAPAASESAVGGGAGPTASTGSTAG